jgi:hypothetical protein
LKSRGCLESPIAIENKNHKHRYINVSNTLMGASISRKNDLLDTPFPLFLKHLHSRQQEMPASFSSVRPFKRTREPLLFMYGTMILGDVYEPRYFAY